MRTVLHQHMQLGETDIGAIVIDAKSRDDIPQLLRGLQHLYTDVSVHKRVFAILDDVLPEFTGAEGKASATMGRPGLVQWKILFLSVHRLGLNADYDRIGQPAPYDCKRITKQMPN